MEEKKINHKTIQGVVVSDKMDKTITVLVTSKKKHPIYKKYVTYTKKYKAHDEKNDAHVGDTVEIQETRPLSRDKYFRLLSIVERAK
ncbi:MAG: 30S ribosomal protein S17 [Clostridia bacterium]|nr:30S ribosomal protein S17 [Clostridia bacterium]MCQ2564423.1 30S ribosomal protein S17 [Clostridia bacterium]